MTLPMILKDTNLNGVKILKTFGNYYAKKKTGVTRPFFTHTFVRRNLKKITIIKGSKVCMVLLFSTAGVRV